MCTLLMKENKTFLKAQEDAEKLRSVVMPMEQEIGALKAKLTTAEERVKELEASKVSQQWTFTRFRNFLFSKIVNDPVCLIFPPGEGTQSRSGG